MTRAVTILSGETTLVRGVYEDVLDHSRGTADQRILGEMITVYVDGKKITELPLPPKLLDSEPVEIGSQVRGLVRLSSKEAVFTKIGHDTWVFQHEVNWKNTTTSVRWQDISVWEVIKPAPEPPKPEEPEGWAAVVKTDCHSGCGENAMFLKFPTSAGDDCSWVCRRCNADYPWSELVKGSSEIKILSAGF